MALRQVEWSSKNRLSCAGCEDSPIVLCLAPGLTDPSNCSGASSFDFLDATIVSVSNLGGGIYRYTVEYDDAGLSNPVNLLIEENILGAFCRSCMSDWVEGLIDCIPEDQNEGIYSQLIYGTGTDGDRTVTGDETLGAFRAIDADNKQQTARAYFYNDLTIDPGAILQLIGSVGGVGSAPDQGVHICLFVNGTLTINGEIHANGLDGASAVAGVGGTAGQIFTAQGEFINDGPGGGGCTGADGGNANSAGGASSGDRSPGAGWTGGGLGGTGGDGGGGGGAGTPTELASVFESRYIVDRWMEALTDFSSAGSFIMNAIGGGSGGGGGGGGSTDGGGGGGGGAAGRSLYIAARNIVIGATGVIRANGGAGGDGADGTADPGDGGGAGAGGGGGLVYIVTQNLTNNGLIEALAGTPGTPGAAVGVGAIGGSAGAAEAGKIVIVDPLTGTVTVT